MEHIPAIATILCVVLLLEVKWRFLSPMREKSTDPIEVATGDPVFGQNPDAAAEQRAAEEQERNTFVANLMERLAQDSADVSNIFADDPRELIFEPRLRQSKFHHYMPSKQGTSHNLDIADWIEDPELAPAIYSDFDTDLDCLVVSGAAHLSDELSIKMTRHGIAVLCLGEMTLASFPELVGEQPIDIVVVEAVAA